MKLSDGTNVRSKKYRAIDKESGKNKRKLCFFGELNEIE
jgi:hypothetical protein